VLILQQLGEIGSEVGKGGGVTNVIQSEWKKKKSAVGTTVVIRPREVDYFSK
jgi:hypothetical protein